MNGNFQVLSDAKIGERIDQYSYEYKKAKDQVEQETDHLKQAQTRYDAIQEAQKIIQDVAQSVQEQVHYQIASVVTRCLEAVFGEDAYQFEIRFEQKRGKTEAQLLLTRNGMEIDPMKAAGGGVVDVTAFALRVVALMLQRPPIRKFLSLDEPCKHLSKQYRPRFRQLLETLSEEMGIQIVMVTHSEEYATGKVIQI